MYIYIYIYIYIRICIFIYVYTHVVHDCSSECGSWHLRSQSYACERVEAFVWLASAFPSPTVVALNLKPHNLNPSLNLKPYIYIHVYLCIYIYICLFIYVQPEVC